MQVGSRRRAVLVGAGVVLAVLVAAFAVVQVGGGAGSGAGDAMSVAPARPLPAISRGSAAQEKGSAAPDVDGSDAQAPGVPLGGVQRELVRTAQLTVEVGDPVAAVRQVRTAAAGAGGFVTEEQTGGTGSWMVLRVPADALDRLLDEVAGYGRVTTRSSQVLDATEQVVDLDARVATQTASVARVRGLLAEAKSIGDVVAVESELARREAELDSLTRRLAALRDQVALSTLTVDLRGPGAVPPPDTGPAPGFLDGLAAGWEGLRAIGSATAAVVGFVLPFVPVLAVLVGFGLLARRVVRARRTPAPAGGSGPDGES
ncbi:DUF4349 domain-containing protein [Pseudonocardia cypriaca]|uniref:Uncharacterized protein DUF4349 n=1 Tax=Pseudonocardia cypriaca TaxID=882449 RepID=A0A543FNN4_9PSEU|nr:DUF4349 domain-containing protein [Pseudonocardia cypriaca]TQM35477.1 uncharacterized protein DUF4349 [Pseudonocardia cypriaca]